MEPKVKIPTNLIVECHSEQEFQETLAWIGANGYNLHYGGANGISSYLNLWSPYYASKNCCGVYIKISPTFDWSHEDMFYFHRNYSTVPILQFSSFMEIYGARIPDEKVLLLL